MSITRHPLSTAELPRIIELVHTMPLICRHVIDLPWRLSSPAHQSGRDAAFWKDETGQLVGLVAWQHYWAVLDFFIPPGPEQQRVTTDLFLWADRRFSELDQARGQPFAYRVEFRDDDVERRQLVEAHGFLHDEGECYVLFQHALNDLPDRSALPDGFQLRQLAGESEAAAYAVLHRAAFDSLSMTTEWRMRTIRGPQYRSELDLVVTAPGGELAAFCVGWFAPTHQSAQIEPLGVHPRFQETGLGRTLLLEMLHRCKALGATRVLVETNLERSAARSVYGSVGFQHVHTIRHTKKMAGGGNEQT